MDQDQIQMCWTEINFESNITKYKLTVNNLLDNSEYLHKFYVSNDLSKNSTELDVRSIENEPNCFILIKWKIVFCYKEVEDFHYLEKQKLTLNFSATQEIDKIQQAEKTKLATAETKLATAEAEITTLKNKVTSLENTLVSVMTRLNELERKI